MRSTGVYVLVTPVRNEAATIGITIRSVLAQTQLPCEWVIVSDQSTDDTDSIVERYARSQPWLRLIRLEDRPARNFASVVFVTTHGIGSLQTRDYAFLGLLDADVRLPSAYYETMLARFAEQPELGLAGGLVMDVPRGGPANTHRNSQEVAGAVQLFRRKCFEDIGSLVAIPEGGWDAVTAAQARMRGWKTRCFAEIVVDHLKPRNSSEGGVLRRHWQLGARDYALAAHPLFELVKCLSRTQELPFVLGAASRYFGYCMAAWRKPRRHIDAATAAFMRREQRARLTRWLSARKPLAGG